MTGLHGNFPGKWSFQKLSFIPWLQYAPRQVKTVSLTPVWWKSVSAHHTKMMPQDASSSSLGGRGYWYTAEPSEPGSPRTKTYINRSWIRTSLGIPILEVSSAATPAWESSGCVIQTLFFSGSTRKICSSSVTKSFVNWVISRSTNSATTLGTESPARKRNTREGCVM